MSSTNRGAKRVPRDNYPTPNWLTAAVLPYLAPLLPPRPRILEPACGRRLAMVKVIQHEWPRAKIDHFDIAPPWRVNFLTAKPRPIYDLIFTNAPFSLTMEFLERAMLWRRDQNSLIVILQRLSFTIPQSRIKWNRAHPCDLFISPRRPKFLSEKSGDSCDYAWHSWPGKGRFILLPTETEKFR